jgi:hypothetical protein
MNVENIQGVVPGQQRCSVVPRTYLWQRCYTGGFLAPYLNIYIDGNTGNPVFVIPRVLPPRHNPAGLMRNVAFFEVRWRIDWSILWVALYVHIFALI